MVSIIDIANSYQHDLTGTIQARCGEMAFKPEKIGRKVSPRAKRDAKKAATRIARRLGRLDPENAPIRRTILGWV